MSGLGRGMQRGRRHSRQKNNNNQHIGRTKRIQGEAREIGQDLLSHRKSSVIYPKSNSKALKVTNKGEDINFFKWFCCTLWRISTRAIEERSHS